MPKRDVLLAIDIQDDFLTTIQEQFDYEDWVMKDYRDYCQIIVLEALKADVHVIELNYGRSRNADMIPATCHIEDGHVLFKEDDDGSEIVLQYLRAIGNRLHMKNLYVIGVNRAYCVGDTVFGIAKAIGIKPKLIDDAIMCYSTKPNWGQLAVGTRKSQLNKELAQLLKKTVKRGTPEWLREARIRAE